MDLKNILLDALTQEMQKRKAHDQRVDQNVAALKAAGWDDRKVLRLQASAGIMERVLDIIRSESAADMILAGDTVFAKMIVGMIDAAITCCRLSIESVTILRSKMAVDDDEPSADTVKATAEFTLTELERRRLIADYVASGHPDVAKEFGEREVAWHNEASEAHAKIRAMHEADLAMRRVMQQSTTITKQ